jgi:flagellar biosynthetic protein FliR
MAGFESLLQGFHVLHAQANGGIDAGLLMLCRFGGFISIAPVLSRKDMPPQFKIGLLLMLSFAMMSHPSVQASANILKSTVITEFMMLMVVNIVLGLFLGFAVRLIFEAVSMAGGFITMQIGLQMASMMDPSTKQSSAIMGPIFSGVASIIFVYVGGIELLLKTLDKSLGLVPLHVLNVAFFKVITVYQWIDTSASIIPLAMLISAPFYITTILMDCILGIVNKTAQQIPVFQLSASIKPLLGLIIFFVTVPTLFPLIRHIMITMLLRI